MGRLENIWIKAAQSMFVDVNDPLRNHMMDEAEGQLYNSNGQLILEKDIIDVEAKEISVSQEKEE